jgi:hypothetical protein
MHRPVVSGLLALLPALVIAADTVGPFEHWNRSYDPADPQPTAVALDGTIERAQLLSGDDTAGRLDLVTWSATNQAGGWGLGGINLALPAGTNAFLGLARGWTIDEGAANGAGWLYYPKYQQDALVVCGFADADPGDINRVDGAGFGLEGTLPYDRVILTLPWRWVVGGGSAFQMGSYAGNPPEAGLWAVPAGSSLAVAQATQANLLAGLDDVLAGLQPHAHSVGFKLQLLGAGRWQVLIDIDDDGVTDVVADDARAGAKASPFPAMTERSGLLCSARAAMGSKTGTIGRTTIGLTYRQSPTASAPLVDRLPFFVNPHRVVKSSPVVIDGTSWSPAYTMTAQSATLGPAPVPVAQVTGTSQWFIDLPLDPEAITEVDFAQAGQGGDTVVHEQVWWQPLDLYHGDSATIRVGDRVKLQCLSSSGGGALRIDADGDGAADYTGSDADVFVHTYTAAGTYQVRAVDADGVQIGSATVTVAEVRLPKAIACQVGFTRTVDIHTGVHDPAGLVVVANDPRLLAIVRGPAVDNHLRITLKALGRGSPVVEVRQGSANGPLLAARAVDEFTVSTAAMQEIMVDDEDGHASGVITMHPWIPGLGLDLAMFAHSAIFADGPAVSTTTDDLPTRIDPATGEVVADIRVDLLVPPTETAFCMRTLFSQQNQQTVSVGSVDAINGKGCRVAVDRVSFLKCDGSGKGEIGVPKELVVWSVETGYREVNKVKIHDFTHPMSIVQMVTGYPAEPSISLAASALSCPMPIGKHFPRLKSASTHMVTISKETKPGKKYGVKINETVFGWRIEVVNTHKGSGFDLGRKPPGTLDADTSAGSTKDSGTATYQETSTATTTKWWFDGSFTEKNSSAKFTGLYDGHLQRDPGIVPATVISQDPPAIKPVCPYCDTALKVVHVAANPAANHAVLLRPDTISLNTFTPAGLAEAEKALLDAQKALDAANQAVTAAQAAVTAAEADVAAKSAALEKAKTDAEKKLANLRAQRDAAKRRFDQAVQRRDATKKALDAARADYERAKAFTQLSPKEQQKAIRAAKEAGNKTLVNFYQGAAGFVRDYEAATRRLVVEEKAVTDAEKALSDAQAALDAAIKADPAVAAAQAALDAANATLTQCKKDLDAAKTAVTAATKTRDAAQDKVDALHLQQQRWEKARNDTLAHEEVHRSIAVEKASEMAKEINKLRAWGWVSADESGAEEAARKLAVDRYDTESANIANDYNSKLDEKQDQMDTVTNHGANQGAWPVK